MNGGVYTAKKTLPRLLIAAILINLSIYIVAAAVDITNVIGAGLSEILLSPFGNNLIIKPGVASSTAVLAIGATAIGGGTLAAFGIGTAALAALGSLAGAALPVLLLFVVLPLVLADNLCAMGAPKHRKTWRKGHLSVFQNARTILDSHNHICPICYNRRHFRERSHLRAIRSNRRPFATGHIAPWFHLCLQVRR